MTQGQKESEISFGPWNHDRWLSQQRTPSPLCQQMSAFARPTSLLCQQTTPAFVKPPPPSNVGKIYKQPITSKSITWFQTSCWLRNENKASKRRTYNTTESLDILNSTAWFFIIIITVGQFVHVNKLWYWSWGWIVTSAMVLIVFCKLFLNVFGCII